MPGRDRRTDSDRKGDRFQRMVLHYLLGFKRPHETVKYLNKGTNGHDLEFNGHTLEVKGLGALFQKSGTIAKTLEQNTQVSRFWIQKTVFDKSKYLALVFEDRVLQIGPLIYIFPIQLIKDYYKNRELRGQSFRLPLHVVRAWIADEKNIKPRELFPKDLTDFVATKPRYDQCSTQ